MNARILFGTVFLFTFASLFQGCASKETITLAGANDQFISIDHGNEQILLNSPLETFYTANADGQGADRLVITRQSVDGTRKVRLSLWGANLKERRLPKAFGLAGGPDAPIGEKVDIDYTSYLLNDDPVCPHLAGETSALRGTIFIDSWTSAGIMSGSFVTDPNQAFQFTGNFQVLIP
ncbi:hypothetical protein [Neolewinella persica]|uniref:hypothetical protein n=1 Tax=Neolewinella persica TaxID=70998 RepID=UPI00035D4CB5|nr:hypothetical protein [Neolewinella persica]